MSERAALLAAVAAARPLSETWNQAVRRLGAWRKVQDAPDAPAKKPGRYTGRSQGEQFWTLTKSSAFDPDREALRAEFQAAGGTRRGQLIEWAQVEIQARKLAIKKALVAA